MDREEHSTDGEKNAMTKPKIALYWCSSCGGCEESVVDLAEGLLDVAEASELVFWPVALDFKRKDIEAVDDGSIAVTLINGSVRMDEQEAMARLLRRKSKVLMAHGSCAHLGGVYGLGNFCRSEELLIRSYRDVPSVRNPEGVLPQKKTAVSGRHLELPAFHDRARPLDQVVDVDYYIPGCPPTPELIQDAIMMVLEERLPPKGEVLAAKTALCDTCPRRESRPETARLKEFKRVYETVWDADRCFLDQGIICLGPATRGGCGARCISANMPCRGCFGPTDQVTDQGAKSLSFVASLFHLENEAELAGLVNSIPDPAGLFYRYSLPSSILGGRIDRRGK